jgi:hypothetical protein
VGKVILADHDINESGSRMDQNLNLVGTIGYDLDERSDLSISRPHDAPHYALEAPEE